MATTKATTPTQRSSARRQSRPSAGDLTGREKAAQARQQAEEIDRRQAEVSMVTAVETEEEVYGIFDPQSGERIDSTVPSVAVFDDEPDDLPSGLLAGFQDDAEPVFSGKEAPEEVTQAVLATQAAQRPVATHVARSPFVTVRVDADIEQMTYGMTPNGEPNNFNFKEGMQYRVPRDIAEHLNGLGLVRQWIG